MKNLETNETIEDVYDVLVFATGASPITPAIPGIESKQVFQVRTIQNTVAINQFITEQQPKKATIIGAGYIGLEMAEQLTRRGLEVTLVQRSNQVLTHMDKDIASRVQEHLIKNGVNLLLNEEVTTISKKEIQTKSGKTMETDLVILATGVRPNVKLAKAIGVMVGDSGAIVVNNKMQTNLPDIYAVGDVAESYSLITGKPLYRPLGSTANKMGRIAGDVITGGSLEHRGILGTGILRVFDLAVGQTGMNETEALKYSII